MMCKRCFTICNNPAEEYINKVPPMVGPFILNWHVILSSMASMSSKYIVLFDGVCNLCNGSVQFILKRDRNKKFLFGSLQGKTGQEYLHKYHLPADQFH